MRKLKKNEMSQIEPLFINIGDSMVTACIQGYMGSAYVDKLPNPKVGLIISGEFSFFAGDCSDPAAFEFAENLFTVNSSKESVCIFDNEGEPGWETVLLSTTANNPKLVSRYGLVQKDYDFDEYKLHYYINNVPIGYELKAFDEDLYNQAMSEDWSKEFCETFESSTHFLENGFGFAITINGKLVSGATTMTVYDGGMESQLATHPDYRKLGLAVPVAAALLLESQHRGLRACWDAANLISKHIALKLGYEYRGEYTTVIMSATI